MGESFRISLRNLWVLGQFGEEAPQRQGIAPGFAVTREPETDAGTISRFLT
jgi:hypothetical protein